jgi:hypothetical protein
MESGSLNLLEHSGPHQATTFIFLYICFVGTLHYKEAIHKLLKRVEFVSDRVSCIVLRDHWSNTIFFKLDAPSGEKGDDTKDSLYEELKQV